MLQLDKNISGLTDDQVQQSLIKYGYNELPTAEQRTLSKMILEVFREPMFFLLLIAGFLYLLLGDVHEALMLLAAIFMVIGITLYQERKTENALAALKNLSSPKALVIREGKRQYIDSREVAIGDLMIIAEGERVPADGLVLHAANLKIDESILTGESVAVSKRVAKKNEAGVRPGGDNSPYVYSGTLVVKGQAVVRVESVGLKTEMGKIGKALDTIQSERSNLQQQTTVVVRNFAIIGLGICVFIVIYFSLTRNDWLNGLLAGLTLAMSMMPEEFPVVLTVFLALGAWRISRKKVLTRRMPAIETLGAVTTLCVDKTGTLTINKMKVEKLCAGKEQLRVNDSQFFQNKFFDLIRYSLLATPLDPFDPMEKAINNLGRKAGIQDRQEAKLLKSYFLSDKLLAMSNAWQMKNGEIVISAKGSPEAIIDICHLEGDDKEQVEEQIKQLAEQGLRVIGVAKAKAGKALPENQHDFKFEYIGLLGLDDPIRPEVPGAISECRSAGIKVIMITGDYPVTAKRIANQIGFEATDKILTGMELEKLTAEQLKEKIKDVSIFARIVPEQKLMIVNALKANGEVVAMTGDGVNDAPALKAAHIGIAMGKRGSDVAREASDIILLDDNFFSIVSAIKVGRRIYENLKKAITFIFSIHIPIAGISLLSVIMEWPLVLFPIHIVFLEMIIDPSCSIVFEMEETEDDIMKRPPRKLNSKLFSSRVMANGFIQGISVFVAIALIYGFALHSGYAEGQARALAFINLIIGNLGLIFINRSRSRNFLSTLKKGNRALWWVVSSAIFFLVIAIGNPFFRKVFRFDPVLWKDLSLSFLVIFAAIVLSDGLKLLLSKKPARVNG